MEDIKFGHLQYVKLRRCYVKTVQQCQRNILQSQSSFQCLVLFTLYYNSSILTGRAECVSVSRPTTSSAYERHGKAQHITVIIFREVVCAVRGNASARQPLQLARVPGPDASTRPEDAFIMVTPPLPPPLPNLNTVARDTSQVFGRSSTPVSTFNAGWPTQTFLTFLSENKISPLCPILLVKIINIHHRFKEQHGQTNISKLTLRRQMSGIPKHNDTILFEKSSSKYFSLLVNNYTKDHSYFYAWSLTILCLNFFVVR